MQIEGQDLCQGLQTKEGSDSPGRILVTLVANNGNGDAIDILELDDCHREEKREQGQTYLFSALKRPLTLELKRTASSTILPTLNLLLLQLDHLRSHHALTLHIIEPQIRLIRINPDLLRRMLQLTRRRAQQDGVEAHLLREGQVQDELFVCVRGEVGATACAADYAAEWMGGLLV